MKYRIPKIKLPGNINVYYLGENVFAVIIALVALSVLISSLVFYVLALSVQNKEITEVTTELQVNEDVFLKVQAEWQKRDQTYNKASLDTIRNIFE